MFVRYRASHKGAFTDSEGEAAHDNHAVQIHGGTTPDVSVRDSRFGVEWGSNEAPDAGYCPSNLRALNCQPVSFSQENFEHLAGLDLADSSDGRSRLKIDILIGSDQYWELITGEIRQGNSGPVAIHTELGWVLSGPVASPTQDQPSTCLVTHALRVDNLPQDVQALDDRIKSFGISGSDRSVNDEFEGSVRIANDRYKVELPWKEAHLTLPDNYHLSL